jgi:hypothetical protein
VLLCIIVTAVGPKGDAQWVVGMTVPKPPLCLVLESHPPFADLHHPHLSTGQCTETKTIPMDGGGDDIQGLPLSLDILAYKEIKSPTS